MSEDKKEENKVISTNVALIVSERDHALELVKKLTDENDVLKQEVAVLQARIEEDTKASLINEISPMTTTPREYLAEKTVDELTHMKKVLSAAKLPVFKAGTPIVTATKTPAVRLASAFDDFASKTWRKS